MYETFYGLREKPFNLLPDPDYLYLSRGHENAYTHLEYAISENKGFVVVTGEIGCGKTTLINFLLRKIEQLVDVGMVNQTDVNPAQFMRMICQEYELDVGDLDKAGMLNLFNEYLVRQFAAGRRVVLIIDEAQNLPLNTMEEIRMLSNLESEKHHLLQIIMVGQPELKYKLQRKGLEQFAQRVTVHCHLFALNRDETARYIRHRLQVAGAADLDLFDEGAIDAIHQHSGGTPRIINILCDTALVYAFADEAKKIDKGIIESIVGERKEAGIYFKASEEVETPAPLPAPEDGAVAQFADRVRSVESRFQSLEARIQSVENHVGEVAQSLQILSLRKDEKDRVLVELLKMIIRNMDSRMRLMLRVLRLGEKMGAIQQEALELEGEA
jgi:general secretion pathway protein A